MLNKVGANMKNFIIVSFILSLLAGAVTKSEFNIEGMTCAAGCAAKVKSIAGAIDGVESCEVNFEKSKATITYDDKKVTAAQILSTLKETTTFKYNVENTCSSSCSKSKCETNCCKKNKKAAKKSFFKKLLESI